MTFEQQGDKKMKLLKHLEWRINLEQFYDNIFYWLTSENLIKIWQLILDFYYCVACQNSKGFCNIISPIVHRVLKIRVLCCTGGLQYVQVAVQCDIPQTCKRGIVEWKRTSPPRLDRRVELGKLVQ